MLIYYFQLSCPLYWLSGVGSIYCLYCQLYLHGSRMMSSTKFSITPPLWNDEVPFERWNAEIQLWVAVTDLAKAKQGPAVALSLTGRKREAALEFSSVELNAEDGLTKLLDKLKSKFGREETDRLFEAYVNFETVARLDRNMTEYIQDFERLYAELKKFKIDVPSEVLACKLLHCAGLDTKDRHLVLSATPDLKFDAMRTSLRRIFTSCVKVDTGDVPSIKPEPTFVTRMDEGNEDSPIYWTIRGRGRGRFNVKRNFGHSQIRQNGTNPVNASGQVSTCANCGSRFHWRKDCPDLQQQRSDEEKVFLTFATVSESMLEECRAMGIIDTGCARSVAGKDWVNQFSAELGESLEYESPKNVSILFGGGKSFRSVGTVRIPLQIGDLKCFILTEVINTKLPLLISAKSL